MRIGQLARSAGVNVETVRYYQRIGLIELPRKPYGGVRSYDNECLRRLLFIRRAQKLGFSLEGRKAKFSQSEATAVTGCRIRSHEDDSTVREAQSSRGLSDYRSLGESIGSTLTPYVSTGRRLHA